MKSRVDNARSAKRCRRPVPDSHYCPALRHQPVGRLAVGFDADVPHRVLRPLGEIEGPLVGGLAGVEGDDRRVEGDAERAAWVSASLISRWGRWAGSSSVASRRRKSSPAIALFNSRRDPRPRLEGAAASLFDHSFNLPRRSLETRLSWTSRVLGAAARSDLVA